MPARRGPEARALIGDARQVERELGAFSEAAHILSSRHPRLIEQYPEQWVAVYDRQVQASARTLVSLMAQLDRKELPKDRVIVRYIDKNQRTMIL